MAPAIGRDSSGGGWAVVSGASSGIGLAFARELARRGHRVLAVARRRDRLEALAREAAEQGDSIVPLVADLQAEGLRVIVERMVGLGTIDLLVNNAGIATFGDFQHKATGRIDGIFPPKLYRRLAVIIHRDKRLDLGVRAMLSALKAISDKVHA